jgi:hypothetical protein
MLMPMMDAAIMMVRVPDRRVMMGMGVRLASIPLEVVLVLMVFVVDVWVRMEKRLVNMFVLVPFGKVQPDADAHQAGCHPEAWRGNFSKHQ